MSDIAKLIEEKIGHPGLLSTISEKLSGSDLNSLLLELFRMKAQNINAAEVLQQFSKSRFPIPSSVDAIAFKEMEIAWLRVAKDHGFVPLTLSPVTPLGTCSAIAYVDQNKVLSATRGMEVLSDATNVMALIVAQQFKKKQNNEVLKYTTTHRHVRTSPLADPKHTAHFGLFAMVTGGMDTGNYAFELEHLPEHLQIHLQQLAMHFPKEKIWAVIEFKEKNDSFSSKLNDRLSKLKSAFTIKLEDTFNTGDYYQLVRFRTYLQLDGNDINLSDGGFVDWTQKLIPNKKHRLIISGAGLELIYKLVNG